jgi:RNA polymerase sigma factor (sigma-70 family)
VSGSDWDLIEACRRGDEQAWQQVVDKYKRLVFSIPLNYGLGQHDAADIVQLTFMMLLQGLDGLHEESHLGGWLATVARRNTWHIIRRHGREQLHPENISDNNSLYDEGREKEKERQELNDWIFDGLSRLDETCRSMLILLYFDPDLNSYKEVAARMKLAVGSIGPMRARCLERLRELMRD